MGYSEDRVGRCMIYVHIYIYSYIENHQSLIELEHLLQKLGLSSLVTHKFATKKT